ncbi:MAG: DoxX family protein [Candidatus Pacebacteria bacterium]|nr:DoxX family protein [Candidatus Paceibacterota bacterium]
MFLNPFPIQFLALLAYFILRVFVAGTLLFLGIKHLRHRHNIKHAMQLRWFPFGLFSVWYLALIEIICGLMFLFGIYTQIAALLVLIMAVKFIFFGKYISSPFIPSRMFYILLTAASLSLFITGAGAFAFDLPI